MCGSGSQQQPHGLFSPEHGNREDCIHESGSILYSSCTVLSPVSFSRWTVQGFALLSDEISGVSKAIGKTPRLLALPVQVNAAQEEKLRETEFAEFAKSTIHRSAAIKAACDSGRSLKENSGSYAQFKALAKELSC